MPDESRVLSDATIGVIDLIRGEESVDDHEEDWYVGTADGAVDGDVDSGVFERAAIAPATTTSGLRMLG